MTGPGPEERPRRAMGTGHGAGWQARAAIKLYPPAWRARYGDEIGALLEDSEPGAGPRAIASLAWHAIPAWVWPARHLYDRPARMRASLATVLLAWSMLAGLGLVFAQLTQFQGDLPAGHPVVGRCYAIFDAALVLSVLAGAAGGLPLWLLLLRRAHREQRRRDLACGLLPVIAPAGFLAAVRVTVALAGHANGVSPGWFLVVTLGGFATAAAAAGGPGLALVRLRPRGPAVRLAAGAAALGVAAILVATAASTVAVIGLDVWTRDLAGQHQGLVLGVYLGLVATAAAVATVSAARGARAAFAGPGSG
jgi:hypothetical protein